MTMAEQSGLRGMRSAAPWKTAVLIGAGRMGRAHAGALRGLGVPLAALCDPRPDARTQVGDEFGVGKDNRFEAAGAMFDRLGGVDLAVIATTADTHAAL